MTSSIATNAGLTAPTERIHYLRANRDGFPIDRQVPRTFQVYSGTGGSMNYDGSNEILINGTALVTPLIIVFGPSSNIKNWIGRSVEIQIFTPNNTTVTLNTSPALMSINGTALTQLSHVIPANGVTKTITLYFSRSTLINVDYGASASNSLFVPPPTTGNTSSSYIYGQDSVISVPSIYIPDSSNYNVVFNSIEPTLEGVITPFVGSVSGPGLQFLAFQFSPAPRRIASTNVTGYITSTGNPDAAFSVNLYPILSNVYDKEYILGSNNDGTLAMYDPLVNFGGLPKAIDAQGSQVNLIGDMGPVAVDVADSLVFSVSNSAPTVIRWKSFTTYNEGDLIDVSTLVTGFWTTGATIVDIDFDDQTSSLLVLPNLPTTGKILSIPIRPYNNSDPNTIKTGVLFGATFALPAASVVHSFAVCPLTREVYIACKPPLFNNSVYKFSPFPALAGPFSYQHPSIAVNRTAVGFSSQGSFFMLFERTLELYQVNNTRGLSTDPSDTTVLYTVPQYHQSLSRNCYGWTQA